MRSFVRGLLVGAWLLAGLLLTGCRSPSLSPDELFLDNPRPQFNNASPSQSQQSPSATNVARFRVGDTVDVIFSGAPVEIPEHEESIKENGTITLPLIGPVVAVGKTSGELQNEIQSDYVPKYYLYLTVTVRSGSRVIYVSGEVNHPGRIIYLGDTTVSKAIQSAGGLTDFANPSKVWLTRASNGQRIRVNYNKAIENSQDDPPVYPDDQIYVARRVF